MSPASAARSVRGPALLAVAVLAVALLAALASSGRRTAGLLDPLASDPSGSRALARVLTREGVEVQKVTTAGQAVQEAGAGTVLVVRDERLSGEDLAVLRSVPGDLVLVTPQDATLAALAPPVAQASGAGSTRALEPACTLAAARAAGVADVGAVRYRVGPGVTADICYPTAGFGSLVVLHEAGRTVTVLGDPAPLTNARAGERGNAALGLWLLGGRRRLTWLYPELAAPSSRSRPLSGQLPAGVRWATLQVALAVLALALWRGRRLGRVVPERLPVVVRASETTAGRARLYRRARARDRVAGELRAAAIARARRSLGLTPGADQPEVVAALAARTGADATAAATLLYGPVPDDDAGLVALAASLDALEDKVRHA